MYVFSANKRNHTIKNTSYTHMWLRFLSSKFSIHISVLFPSSQNLSHLSGKTRAFLCVFYLPVRRHPSSSGMGADRCLLRAPQRRSSAAVLLPQLEGTLPTIARGELHYHSPHTPSKFSKTRPFNFSLL